MERNRIYVSNVSNIKFEAESIWAWYPWWCAFFPMCQHRGTTAEMTQLSDVQNSSKHTASCRTPGSKRHILDRDPLSLSCKFDPVHSNLSQRPARNRTPLGTAATHPGWSAWRRNGSCSASAGAVLPERKGKYHRLPAGIYSADSGPVCPQGRFCWSV